MEDLIHIDEKWFLSHEGWTMLYHCGRQGWNLQACSTQVVSDEDHFPMCGGKV